MGAGAGARASHPRAPGISLKQRSVSPLVPFVRQRSLGPESRAFPSHSKFDVVAERARSRTMGTSATLRRLTAQDPVLTACFVLSAIGLGAPLIVPRIRNAMNRPEVVAPPKLKDVVEGMTGKSRN